MRPIRFGTSGWRGVLGDDFDFARARAVAAALADWVAEQGAGDRVVVAHDTRFLADRLARSLAGVLRDEGLRPVLGAGPVATPVASREVRRRRAAAGLVVTASHNPPEYLGLKVVAPWGGAASAPITRAIEHHARVRLRAGVAAPKPWRRVTDLGTRYRDDLLALLDRPALARADLRIHYDALHGTGAGLLDAVLRRAGVKVTTLRGEADPRFGGAAPDPTPARLDDLARIMRRGRGLRLGLATDGDADRYAVVDADGRILSETDSVALLIDHLARSGRCRRGVALSVATGSLPERVARSHGLPVIRRGIGFKHLSGAFLENVADVAGEESGGFAWEPFARDKDGVLAGCLLAELVAQTGAPLRTRLRDLERAHGAAACGRMALPGGREFEAGLRRLAADPPARFDGARVVDRSRPGGLRLALEDGFAMWRVSGTEPVLRIYAEAPTPRRLAARLDAARGLLRRAARGRRG